MVRLSVGLLLLVLWSVVARAALQEGIDPGAAAASDSKKKPLCFAEVSRDPVQLAQAPPTARQFSRLAGTWEQFSKPSQAQPDPTPFWNLSCPLEWSKYSCVHQGLEAHASAAASWRFVPRDCELPRLLRPGVLAAALGNRSVFIGGDSLARQLFVSLGCRLLHASKVFASPTSVHAEAEWGGPSKRHWSCGSTNNCIQDGPHSGFFFRLRELDDDNVTAGEHCLPGSCQLGHKPRKTRFLPGCEGQPQRSPCAVRHSKVAPNPCRRHCCAGGWCSRSCQQIYAYYFEVVSRIDGRRRHTSLAANVAACICIDRRLWGLSARLPLQTQSCQWGPTCGLR
eukprot:INCI16053.3.p1 GENE.INCI16053.3~~INCI16053.3.p1  ORF type:complete len:339 (-),score=30.18 INCI16053.3:2316-3332(-)